MISDGVGDEAHCESGGKGYDLRMLRRSALFVLWALIGFGLSLEFLYLFTPFGIAGMALIAAVAWFLEGRGLNQQPEIWGLLGGPAAFCLLVASSSDEPTVWALVGAGLAAVALAGFTVSGRARCGSQGLGPTA